MAGYGTPQNPVGGGVITVAYAVTNILDPVRQLRLNTGNGDPSEADTIAIAIGPGQGTSWRKVPMTALAAITVADALAPSSDDVSIGTALSNLAYQIKAILGVAAGNWKSAAPTSLTALSAAVTALSASLGTLASTVANCITTAAADAKYWLRDTAVSSTGNVTLTGDGSANGRITAAAGNFAQLFKNSVGMFDSTESDARYFRKDTGNTTNAGITGTSPGGIFDGIGMRRSGADLYGPDNFTTATYQAALGFTPSRIASGSYAGSGTSSAIQKVTGFLTKLAVIHDASTDTMYIAIAAANSIRLGGGGVGVQGSSSVHLHASNGFTVADGNSQGNVSGITYTWVAFG